MNWIFWLIIFYLLQIVANLLFKYGSIALEHFWMGFLLGNLFGCVSIVPLMRLYQGMQVNLAIALASGITFLLVQMAFLLFYRERLTWIQCVGILGMSLSMFLISWGKAAE